VGGRGREGEQCNAMLEYRRPANNKIGLGQKMKRQDWALRGRGGGFGASENNRGDREWVWALWGMAFMQKGRPYLTLGRSYRQCRL
jgi:hypothetical protein